MMNLIELETALLALMKGKHSSLHISFNDENGPNYMTVDEYAREFKDREQAPGWASEEEKQKAIETNRMWTVHWYPDTPVGFYAISASSLTAAIAAVLEDSAL